MRYSLSPGPFPYKRSWHVTSRELQEQSLPILLEPDRTMRIKVGDSCGLACSFCHNEGTAVSDHKGLAALRNSLPTSGGFSTTNIEPDETFGKALDWARDACGIEEIHLTGGEPTRHPQLADIVAMGATRGLRVKVTSNGERGPWDWQSLKDAGLASVNFSIHGLTPAELKATQHPDYPTRLLEQRVAALKEAIATALDCGIKVKANVVITPPSGQERAANAIDTLDPRVSLRLQPELQNQHEGLDAIRLLLAEYRATPYERRMMTGTSNEQITYVIRNNNVRTIPPGERNQIIVKYFRHSRLTSICNGCDIGTRGDCHEGYYGLRLSRTTLGYMLGFCMLRQDVNMLFDTARQQHEQYPETSLATAVRQQPITDALALVTNPRVQDADGRYQTRRFRWLGEESLG